MNRNVLLLQTNIQNYKMPTFKVLTNLTELPMNHVSIMIKYNNIVNQIDGNTK